MIHALDSLITIPRRGRRARLAAAAAAAVLAGLTGGALAACAAERPPVHVGADAAVVDPFARNFLTQRDRFVRRMGHQLGDLDEQVEMLDAMLAERDGQTETAATRAMTRARAALEHQRGLAAGAVARAKLATQATWPAHEAGTQAAVEDVETSYQTAVGQLY